MSKVKYLYRGDKMLKESDLKFNHCPLCQSYGGIEIDLGVLGNDEQGYQSSLYCADCGIQISDETIDGAIEKWDSLATIP